MINITPSTKSFTKKSQSLWHGDGHDSGQLLGHQIKVESMCDDDAQIEQDGDAVQGAEFAADFVVLFHLLGFEGGHVELHDANLMPVVRALLVGLASPHDASRGRAKVERVDQVAG